MRLDPIVSRRFSELQAKGEAVLAAKVVDYQGADGTDYYKIPPGAFQEWATNVLNLLQRSFGEDSVHFKHFAERYRKFEGWISDFEESFGVFKAAQEDWLHGYLFNIRTLAKAEFSLTPWSRPRNFSPRATRTPHASSLASPSKLHSKILPVGIPSQKRSLNE